MRDIAERAAPAWSDEIPDYSFPCCRAFSNEEAGDYVTAEKAGRGAVERGQKVLGHTPLPTCW